MSVGLLIQGEFERTLLSRLKEPSSQDRLERIARWFREHCSDAMPETSLVTNDGIPTLYVSLHPAAQDVEIAIDGASRLTVDANTSTAGPGFHIFLCEALHRLGQDLSIKWMPQTEEYLDETGYFYSGNRSEVFQQMCDWIEGIANLFFDGSLDPGANAKIAMPMHIQYSWETTGALTAMGPRDLAWLQHTAQDGQMGSDFFAWWEPNLDAQYFLRRALTRMWCDVRWRPHTTDAERRHLNEVADCLERAYKLDPLLDYPWAEWSEVLHLLDRRDEHGVGGRELDPKRIGYRRQDVRVEMPGRWWIQLPGSFSDFEADDGASCSLDPPREIWFTGYAFTEPGEEALRSWKNEATVVDTELLVEKDGYFASAQIEKKLTEAGKEYFALQSSNICRSGRCVCTIIFEDPSERSWAIETWKSLQPPDEPEQ